MHPVDGLGAPVTALVVAAGGTAGGTGIVAALALGELGLDTALAHVEAEGRAADVIGDDEAADQQQDDHKAPTPVIRLLAHRDQSLESENQGRNRIATSEPTHAMANQIQPCRLAEAMPESMAPILQPKARRAP